MSSLGTSKGILEISKFGVYLAVPIFMMYTFANNTKNLQKFMGNARSLLGAVLLGGESLFNSPPAPSAVEINRLLEVGLEVH